MARIKSKKRRFIIAADLQRLYPDPKDFAEAQKRLTLSGIEVRGQPPSFGGGEGRSFGTSDTVRMPSQGSMAHQSMRQLGAVPMEGSNREVMGLFQSPATAPPGENTGLTTFAPEILSTTGQVFGGPGGAGLGHMIGREAQVAERSLRGMPEDMIPGQVDILAEGLTVAGVGKAAEFIPKAISAVTPTSQEAVEGTMKAARSGALGPSGVNKIVDPRKVSPGLSVGKGQRLSMFAESDLGAKIATRIGKEGSKVSPVVAAKDTFISQLDDQGVKLQEPQVAKFIEEMLDFFQPKQGGPAAQTLGPESVAAQSRLNLMAKKLFEEAEASPDGALGFGRTIEILRSFQKSGFEGTGGSQFKAATRQLQANLEKRILGVLSPEQANKFQAMNASIHNRLNNLEKATKKWIEGPAEGRVRRLFDPNNDHIKRTLQEFDNINGTNFVEEARLLNLQRQFNPDPRLSAAEKRLGVFFVRALQRIPIINPGPLLRSSLKAAGPAPLIASEFLDVFKPPRLFEASNSKTPTLAKKP